MRSRDGVFRNQKQTKGELNMGKSGFLKEIKRLDKKKLHGFDIHEVLAKTIIKKLGLKPRASSTAFVVS